MSTTGGGGDGGGDGSESNKRRRVLLDSDDEEDMAPAPPPPPPPLSPLPGLDDRHDDGSDLEEVVEEEGIEDERLTDNDEDGAAAGLSDEDGEDLMENMEADYVAIPELDTYDMGNLDQREYGAMDFDARRAAEVEIAERTEQRGRLDDILDRYGDEDEEARDRRRGAFDQRRAQEGMMGLDGSLEVEDEDLNLEAYDVPLREWIAEDRTRREVKRRFRSLLEESKDGNGRLRYMDSIRNMCAANLRSLEVHYEVLRQEQATLALWLMDAPEDILEVFDEVANEVVLKHYKHYKTMLRDEVHVRIVGHEIVLSLRLLRQSHLNKLVRVVGVVTRRTQVFPQIQSVTFDCANCKSSVGPFKQTEGAEIRPEMCTVCDRTGTFRINQAATVYRDYQKIVLQESPGTVPAGRVPRYKEVILTADLIDRARPGEDIEVTGIYKYRAEGLNGKQKGGFPVFSTCIDANFIHKREDLFSMFHITDDDKADIHRIAAAPNTSELLISAFAPSIHGHEKVKLALLLALFSGVEKNIYNKHRIRGDINVLLLGDPGTAKSQFLKYLEKVAPRAAYTTGKGASAVGLTAGVHKDPMTKEWTLEGGALVLADRGMCLIDEFDKMNDGDRTSIHEALEQQSISVSKAGIVTSLQARCSVVAAANPIGGRYDSSLTFAENVELTDPILQRLDMLCVLQDIVDPIADERLADFVVRSHQRSHPSQAVAGGIGTEHETNPETAALAAEGGVTTVSQRLFTKYIMYARSNVRPQIQDVDQDKIERLYVDLRRESKQCGGVPIAVRHIESIIRMSEAHAKMHLRDHVRDDDVNVAIGLMLHSFLQAQKFSVRTSLERGFRRYITRVTDFNQLLMSELQKLMKDNLTYNLMRRARGPEEEEPVLEVPLSELEERAAELRIYDIRPFLQGEMFKGQGLVVETLVGRQGAVKMIRKVK
ncbi:hypothetical protein VYU27_003385 [Nannochloropsis oceanica]